MKRADQLAPLSREHHQGLVVAQHAIQLKVDADEALIVEKWRNIQAHLQDMLEHFGIEECFVLEPLKGFAQCEEMVNKIYQEHEQLRAFAKLTPVADFTALQQVGALLKAHIKFEEKVLFPMAQELLSHEQLVAAYQAHPEAKLKSEFNA